MDHDEPGLDAASTLLDFTRKLSDEQTVEAVFHLLGEYCTDVLGIDGAGILLLQDGDLVVATTSNKLGEAAEQLEADLAEGPCTDAIRTGEHVLAPDLAAVADRWPRFAPRALTAGVRGIHGLPMGARSGYPIGALNLVTGESRALTGRQLRVADMLTEVAVSYLVSIEAQQQANQLAEQLQHALNSRVVIEQAKGILAGRHSLGLSDAFEVIRRYSRRTNTPIHSVARQICDGDIDLT